MVLQPGQGPADQAQGFTRSRRPLKDPEFTVLQNSEKFFHKIILNVVRRKREAEIFRSFHFQLIFPNETLAKLVLRNTLNY